MGGLKPLVVVGITLAVIACGGSTTPEQALQERAQAHTDAWLSGNMEEMTST